MFNCFLIVYTNKQTLYNIEYTMSQGHRAKGTVVYLFQSPSCQTVVLKHWKYLVRVIRAHVTTQNANKTGQWQGHHNSDKNAVSDEH